MCEEGSLKGRIEAILEQNREKLGILVLLQVSQPMTRLRKAVLLVMAAGLVAAFLALGGVFAVDVYDGPTAGLMLLMMGCAAVLYWGLACLVEAVANRRRK